jgi:hypothetical protein
MSAVHIFGPDTNLARQWDVWLDIEEEGDHDGLCIGVGTTKLSAIECAQTELRTQQRHLKALRKKEASI